MDIRVGDFIILKPNQRVPADMVFLHTTRRAGSRTSARSSWTARPTGSCGTRADRADAGGRRHQGVRPGARRRAAAAGHRRCHSGRDRGEEAAANPFSLDASEDDEEVESKLGMHRSTHASTFDPEVERDLRFKVDQRGGLQGGIAGGLGQRGDDEDEVQSTHERRAELAEK